MVRPTLGQLLVLVWCCSSSPTNTHNPPCEQLLTGLVAGAGLSVGGVGGGCGAGIIYLVPCLLLFVVPLAPHSLVSLSPIPVIYCTCPHCPFPVSCHPTIHPASKGSQQWHRVEVGVLSQGPSLHV
jgi:hypothetical protein